MADRDVDGPDADLTAQDGPDDLPLVYHRVPVAARRAGRVVDADEVRLGDADGRHARRQPQVAGQPEAAGVDAAVAVTQDEIRRGLDHGQRRQRARQLAEGQQARDVGERCWDAGQPPLDRRQLGKAQDNHGGAGRAPAVLEAHVHAGHVAHLAQFVPLDHLVAQRLLQGDGLGRGGGPGM